MIHFKKINDKNNNNLIIIDDNNAKILINKIQYLKLIIIQL